MENLRGAGLMVLAMLLFALEDMLIKLMANVLPIGQIVGMLGAGSAVFNISRGDDGGIAAGLAVIRIKACCGNKDIF